MMKRVLLYLGKFPGYGFDIDGGSILARQLIDSLKANCVLDVVFIRKNRETYVDPAVHSVRYVEYKDAKNNKFLRRLENLDTNQEAIGYFGVYDIIITAHISKFFGLNEMPEEFWAKTILFPMFCTPSYRKAGENVPIEYTSLENEVIKKVGKIITPSNAEKDDIIRFYKIHGDKIVVIPRGVNPAFLVTNVKECSDSPNLVYIGSIKKQKNNLDAIKVLERLRELGLDARLHLICTIQDADMYDMIMDYISCHQLADHVYMHIEIKQEEVAILLKTMDVNISVSNWETFGRGIFEGISAGLPTFVYNNLSGVKEICKDNDGIVYVNDSEQMAQKIMETCCNMDLYHHRASCLTNVAMAVSYERERQFLIHEILDN